MPETNHKQYDFPDHVEETIEGIKRLYDEHQTKASPQQRAISQITDLIARPMSAVGLFVAILAWILANAFTAIHGPPAIDPPPFQWLQGAMTITSLFLVIFVLGAQKHEDEFNKKQELLTLELAILGEQKIAKVIRLLEEFRRDSPEVLDRLDQEAEAMAQPTNPHSVLHAIEETR